MMADTTVGQFADELKLPVSAVLSQLHRAGVQKASGEDSFTVADKTALLEFLRQQSQSLMNKTKIVLTRKEIAADTIAAPDEKRPKILLRRKFAGQGKPTVPEWMAMSASDRQEFRIQARASADMRWHVEFLDSCRRNKLEEIRRQSIKPVQHEPPKIDSLNVCNVTKPVPLSKELEQHFKMMELLESDDS
ncbi:translation initiation factor IF-2 N-terminal domain-containing protein [Dechloromonas sp. ZS-1]|uniref:translation initiation factor IF-2 N-terminal domain-containing protein n=1 Tax=Dechloromonas sp. ZS-1 TaxID=3138067 RepID=UPI0031FD82B8